MTDATYKIAVEVTGTTADADNRLDKLSSTIKELRGQFAATSKSVNESKQFNKEWSDSLAASGSGAEEANGEFSDLNEVFEELSRTRVILGHGFGQLGSDIGVLSHALAGGGLIGIVAGAVFAFKGLVEWIEKTAEKTEELSRASDYLDLPIDTVKKYSDSWLDVAESLRDAARGFDDLSDAQERAFRNLGIDSSSSGVQDKILTRVAAMSGEHADKVDVLRILTGLSADEAAKELDKEMKRLAEQVGGYRDYYDNLVGSRTRAQIEGVQIGKENAGQLLRSGAVVPPAQLRRDQRELDDAIRDSLKRQEELDTEAKQKADKAVRDAAKYAEEVEATHMATVRRQLKEESDAVEESWKEKREATEEGVRQSEKAYGELVKLAEQSGEEASKNLVLPFQEFTDTLKDSLKDSVDAADFSLKHLVGNIIARLTSRELYAAIDKLGDALQGALIGGGGGGFLGGALNFVGGLFGGKAGGGFSDRPTRVGEDGPEWAIPVPGGMRIMNRRQMAFAGSGGGGQQIVYAPVNNYTLSGVETQQVIAYVERGRQADQQAFVKRLKDNGYGRLR